MKTHAFYIAIILGLIFLLIASNTTNIWRWYVDYEEMSILEIEEPLKLKHPQSGETIGVLYKGATLKNVDLDEMLGDIGDNNTYKLIIELEPPYINWTNVPPESSQQYYYGSK